MKPEHFRMAFAPLLLGVAVAIIPALLLKETGVAARTSSSVLRQKV